MKVLFLGSGPFAIPSLERLARLAPGRFDLLVATRPPKPARRGRRLRPTPVAERAQALGLAPLQPPSVNDPATLEELRRHDVRLAIVADYGEILRRAFLELPQAGVFNLHASLLPRHRGAAPVAHAILQGDRVTGVTLFRVVEALDAGPIVAQAETEIRPEETAGELEERLALLAADLLEAHLPLLLSGRAEGVPQDPALVTYAPKLTKEAGAIPWDLEPERVRDFVRAMRPWPLAYSYLQGGEGGGERTIFLRVTPLAEPVSAEPGTVVAVEREAFSVACRGGRVRVEEIQRAGGRPMSAAAYLRGKRLRGGERFASELSESGGSHHVGNRR